MKTLKTWATAFAMVAVSGAAQAALVDRGGGMIYDTTRNITWLTDMNVNGRMTWYAATAWADNLVYGGFSVGSRQSSKPPCTRLLAQVVAAAQVMRPLVFMFASQVMLRVVS